MENVQANRFVGPVIKNSEIGEAVVEAVYEDNEGKKIEIEEHTSYMRIKVEKECILRFETVARMLGRDVSRSDIEMNMPSMEGFIRIDSEKMRFVATADTK